MNQPFILFFLIGILCFAYYFITKVLVEAEGLQKYAILTRLIFYGSVCSFVLFFYYFIRYYWEIVQR